MDTILTCGRSKKMGSVPDGGAKYFSLLLSVPVGSPANPASYPIGTGCFSLGGNVAEA
jgi:hypothetical protein